MTFPEDNFLENRLEVIKNEHLFRTLEHKEHLIDFASNDYLGLARSQSLKELIFQKLGEIENGKNGATGSRLISGNTVYAETLEQSIARYHAAETGLLFNSGYDANLGLFASIAHRGDTLITDELVHASIIDGVRLSYARRYRFRHNDLADLEKKLKLATGNIFIGVESVYSMDGDEAPLQDMATLAKRYGAHLIVDEAHANGVFGTGGEGLVCVHRLESKVLARIFTFGKALGVHGAIIVGSNSLRDYLINFARSFIYTTAQPIHALVAIDCAYDLLSQSNDQRQVLQHHIAYFREKAKTLPWPLLNSHSPIQGLIIPGNEAVKQVSHHLAQAGYYAKAIVSPTVPPGKERLRICLHAFNTREEIGGLLTCLHQINIKK